MDSMIFNKTNLIIFLVIFLITGVVIWFVLPKIITIPWPQGTNSESQNENITGYDNLNPIEYDSPTGQNEHFNGKTESENNNKEIEGISQESMSKVPSNYYFLDDGANGEYSIQHNMCSKSCCSAQYPVPFKQKYDPYICDNKDKFVGSNIMCNNSYQDSGCLCLTKKQSQFLKNRGTNGSEFF